jgi:CelD/BcsL family acetyltransferase involved in cellulose biosynthesis
VSTPGKLSIREITDLESLRLLAPEWSELCHRCQNTMPFQRPEWLLPWVEVFQPRQIWVLEARRDKQLAGLAPLFVNHWAPEPVLAILGAYTSDYLDWLVEPDFAPETLASLLEYINDDALAVRGLDLTNLPRGAWLLRPEFWKRWQFEATADDACPILWLPKTIEELRTVIPRGQLRNLRTAQRRAERVGEVRIEIATRETLDELLEALLRLHQARWTELRMPGLLADYDVQQFHRCASRALLDCGVLRLYGLRVAGVLIAALYTLTERDVVFCYLQGFDPDYAALSPGVQIVGAVIEDAVQKGKHAVDFLRGREAYKYSWGAQDEPTFRLQVRQRRPRTSMLVEQQNAA